MLFLVLTSIELSYYLTNGTQLGLLLGLLLVCFLGIEHNLSLFLRLNHAAVLHSSNGGHSYLKTLVAEWTHESRSGNESGPFKHSTAYQHGMAFLAYSTQLGSSARQGTARPGGSHSRLAVQGP